MHNILQARNATKTGVFVVQNVLRLAFAHFSELRTQVCAIDIQMAEFFTGVGIIRVAQSMRASNRREVAALQSASFLYSVNNF